MSNEDWALWLERYRVNCQLEGLSPLTVHVQSLLIEKFFAWCRPLEVVSPAQMTLELLADYRRHRIQCVNSRGRPDQPTTFNRHVVALRVFLGFLKDRGAIPGAILNVLKFMKEPRRLPKNTPVHQEMMKLLQSVPGDTPIHVRDRAILEVFYSSAIRRAELAHLTLLDPDLEHGLARINQGKGGKDRIVPIGVHAIDWIKRYLVSSRPYLMKGKDEHGMLFVSKSGRPLKPDAMNIIVGRWSNAAGIEKKLSPHALRRSCATEMIRNGANPSDVKDLLGHDDFSSLGPYVKLVAADLKEAQAKYHPRERG